MTVRLANTCTRPVEVHLTGGVVVIPALSQIDCSPEDLALGQVAALCRRGVLVAHEPPVEAAPAAKPRRRPAKKRTS
ncbi:hypothetical protein AB0F52_15190 [Amycolatopsis sp. NPDC024027]|uniref:hypothetical protein n=1 Tax=Amycolatopsis sp. NPDC024027 TaxID=3154327 RepID=UPI0019E6B341|nr:hypothetical protein [Amycolatopsis sp. H6(2020)]